jgi:FixJ family two-component response regulator
MTEMLPHVVVVDDDPSVLKGLVRLLRAWSFQVRACGSAHELLQSVPHEAFDCIVIDVHMPGLSGLELQAELNRQERRVPVVFVTGHSDLAARDRALAAGAAAFLQKPFADKELVQAVEQAIARHKDGVLAAAKRA